ncbi:hypothetical protein CAEBREN_08909 [Caenorhabditis brenneri]|uniref:Uncharacterized protein n=1 Tax=Caenorhabditis brenneri TaxID=135651 RepID=G0MZL2_CAEBE|nr:hypothetical protein CAEBREN_08909 [Caenorhabditis brenneri]
MLPDTTDNYDEEVTDHPQFASTRSGTSSLQSSLSKRANSTRRSLKELSEGVQQRFQPITHGRSLQRISEDESPTTPKAPPRPNRQLYRNSIDQLSMSEAALKTQTSEEDKSVVSEGQRSNWSQSVERIENALHRNYYTIAYSIVIVAYLAGFTEYLYFRLTSLIVPEHLVFHPPCEGKATRKIGKDGFHYGVSICAFIGVAIFQLMCFFGLTISEKWTQSKENPRESRQAAQREEFALFVRTMISSTMYRVFLCYGICSLINCAIIFYMVGIQDSLGDVVSTIFLYVFDAVVILYFIAFPLTTVIYHPYVNCFRQRRGVPARFTLPDVGARTQTSTLESNISGLEEAMAKPPGGTPPVHRNTTPPQIPSLNFSRQDPLRQGHRPTGSISADIPVLEEYLHSPRRQLPYPKPTLAIEENVDDERITTFV